MVDDHKLPAKVIVMGASAGGVDALSAVVSGLPADLDAPVLVVLHVSPVGTSVLPEILSRVGPLRAHHAADGEKLQAGRIYVAPPDFHLEVVRGRVRVTRGPKENGVRPALDTLFRSAAQAYGRGVIGVVLSGTLDDGTAGLVEIKARGGVGVAQEPSSAMFPSMPENAVRFAGPDHVMAVDEIAPLLAKLTEDGAAVTNPESDAGLEEPQGPPTEFTCPECGGTLWEIPVAGERLIRLRCRVGHAYSLDSLMQEQLGSLEAALWAAVVALEERRDLAERLAGRMTARSSGRARRYQMEARAAGRKAEQIRGVLLDLDRSSPQEAEAKNAEGA
jgi:two-component system chemotaxis response regulator CheB